MSADRLANFPKVDFHEYPPGHRRFFVLVDFVVGCAASIHLASRQLRMACSGLCKLVSGCIIVIAVILKIIGICLVKYNPSGYSESSDRKRFVGIILILTAVLMMITGCIMCCCTYQVNICTGCKKKSTGHGQQIIVIQGSSQPAPQPIPQHVPPPPQPSPRQIPQGFGQQYVPPQQPLGFLTGPQYGPSSSTNHQFVQHYDLSQPSQNPGFISPPQQWSNQPSGHPKPYPTQPQPISVLLAHHPPSYEQSHAMPSAPPAEDKAYNQKY
nr:hypothetical protein HmN_000932900 [Hymenolepis microstoma]